MIEKIIELSLRNRPMIVICVVALVGASFFFAQNARIDAIPDIGENQQIVFTEWSGRSAQDVEDHITYPLSSLVQGIPGVDRVRGMSAFGFSAVSIIFKDNVDFYWSRTRVLEKLSSSSSALPKDVTPTLGPDATGLGQIFWYTLENDPKNPDPKSLQELRSLQDFKLRYYLQSVDGVAEVASIGGHVKEYQVDVDPLKIMAFDAHFPQIVRAIENSNTDVGAQVIEEGERELIVRGLGQFDKISDIEEVVVALKSQTPIRVKDVASVQAGPAFRRGVLDKNGKEVVGGIVTMRFGENPADVIKRVKHKIEQAQKSLPSGVVIKPFYDRSELVGKTIDTVYGALFQEVIITFIVIGIFLLHFKSAFLVGLTLPLGVGISFIFMSILKIDSNIMSLSGLVIAIGSMVDMGIIMLENIHAALSSQPIKDARERLRVIANAAKEVGPAITTALLTTIVTFIPVFALQGAEGKLFTPLAWAKTLAMIGSVVVAIVIIPVLSVYLLKGELTPIEKNKAGKKLQDIYAKILEWVLIRRKRFLAMVGLILLISLVAYKDLGREFMPSLNEGDILYMPVTTSDVSLTKARELLAYTDKVIQEHPLVEMAVGKLGRAQTALDPAPVAMFETLIRLKPKHEWPLGADIYDIMQELDERLQVPGLVNSWDFPIQTRIGMISTGIKTQVAAKIFGDDIDKLEEYAQKISKVLEKVPGAYGIYPEQIGGRPYVEFDIDRVAASRYGVNTGDVNSIIRGAIGGVEVTQMLEGRERYSVRVRYKKEVRDRLDDLKNILIATPSGLHIPITQLATIKIRTGPAVIQSENGMLRSTVQLNVKDRDVIGFVEEAKAAVEKEVSVEPGFAIEWDGQYKNQQRANKKLLILIPLSLMLNLLIIYWRFRSWALSALVFSAVPISAAGGFILLWALGINLSVAVWVGFIALFGIAVDDGVVMATFLKREMEENTPSTLQELKAAIVRAGSRRIRPLLMTSVTTIAALLPVMVSTGQGSEVMRPMAVPVLGGMALELVSLFVLPIVFSFVYEKKITRRI